MLFDEEQLLQSLEFAAVRVGMHDRKFGRILPAQKWGCSQSAILAFNITNVQSLIRLKEMGLESATLSIEMPMADCTAMSPVLPRNFRLRPAALDDRANCPAAAEKRLPGLPGIPGHVRPAARPFLADCGGKKTADVNPARRFTTICRCIWPTGWTNAVPGFSHSVFYR